MIVFHGSNCIAKTKIINDGIDKDFGHGFYTIQLEKQAIRWAMSKSKKHGGIPIFKYI